MSLRSGSQLGLLVRCTTKSGGYSTSALPMILFYAPASSQLLVVVIVLSRIPQRGSGAVTSVNCLFTFKNRLKTFTTVFAVRSLLFLSTFLIYFSKCERKVLHLLTVDAMWIRFTDSRHFQHLTSTGRRNCMTTQC